MLVVLQRNGGYLLRGTECLEFIVTKNIREDFITVQIRYRGHLLGTFQQQAKSTSGYRFTEEGSNSFKDLPKSLDVSKLNKVIAELLNYSLTDNIAQFRVIVDSKRLSYIKYNFRNKRVEVGGTDLYIVGTERNTKIPKQENLYYFTQLLESIFLEYVIFVRVGGMILSLQRIYLRLRYGIAKLLQRVKLNVSLLGIKIFP